MAKMSIPALTMFPIPYIEINEITLDFNVKLNSVSSFETSTTDFNQNAGSAGAESVNFKAAVSTQRQTRGNIKIARDYSLSVHLKATQAPLPVGIQRILDQLDLAIQTRK
jgi:hypothetical protein